MPIMGIKLMNEEKFLRIIDGSLEKSNGHPGLHCQNVEDELEQVSLDVADKCHGQTYVDFLISMGAKHRHEIE